MARRVVSLAVVPAAAPCTSASARTAAGPSGAAPRTAAAAAPAPSSPDTSDVIVRPRTWGECQRAGWGEAEPCPWVGCRHHLLLDVVAVSRYSGARGAGQGLRLYGERAHGRPRVWRPRTELAAARFQARALRALERLGATCSIRVAFARLTVESVGEAIEVSRQGAAQAMRAALVSLLEASAARGLRRHEVVAGVTYLVQQSELMARNHSDGVDV